MYTLDTENCTKMAKRYLIASGIIAAASAIYEMYSHGVYSPFMIFSFAIPLLLGALPWFAAMRWSRADTNACSGLTKILTRPGAPDIQLAVIATLTVGSLLKGALDIYGTSNRLLIAYPVTAALILAAAAAMVIKNNFVKKSE